MRGVFISYRREDVEGHAGRLFQDLAAQFGKDAVFMDVAGIEPGRDFRRVIDQQVASCGVLLALIGKGWLDAKNEAGVRRLDDPMDFVRLETAAALKRDIPVIPVLVHGGKMPRAEELPEDLKDLVYRNGVELTHARWDSDVQVLVKALRACVDYPEKESSSVNKAAAVERPTAKLGTGSKGPTSEAPGLRDDATTTVPGWGNKRWRAVVVAAAIAVALGGYFSYEKFAAEKTEAEKAQAEAARAEAEVVSAQAAAEKAAAEKAAAEKAAAGKVAAEKAAAEKAAAERAAVQKVPGKATDSHAIPNFAGTWIETNPSSGPPMRLDLNQDDSGVAVRLSYTQNVGGVFGHATVTDGNAVWRASQGCGEQFRKPGYNYDNPGVNVFSLRLDGAILVYEQETRWLAPCDGHPVGTERMVRRLRRTS